MTTGPWTHDALVERSAAWLRSTKKCIRTIIASARYDEEHPDAIGWTRAGESVVVESKVCRADFYKDKYKPWRFHSRGMGMWKFYLFAPDLLTPTDFAYYRSGHFWCMGCGLLVPKGNRLVEVVTSHPRQDRDWAAEIRLLVYDNGQAVTDATKEEGGT